MDWKDLAADVSKFAPAIGGALGGPAGGAVGTVLASVFGAENDAQAVSEAIQADPQAAAKLKAAEMDHAAEMRRMVLEAETSRLAEVNKTMRTEASAEDAYVRRWRPTFGYIMAASFGLLVLGIVALIVSAPFADPKSIEATASMVQALSGTLMTLFGVGLSVLGVSVRNRSRDKQVSAGQQPTGLLDGLLKR